MRMNDFDSYMKQNIRPVSPSEAFDANIRATLNRLPSELGRERARRRSWILVLHAVVVAIALVFLLPGSEAILSTEWLYAHPSEDEEQYVIEGRVFEPEIIERADADNPNQFVTSSYEEFLACVECDLKIPQTILSVWMPKNYVCTNSFDGKMLTINYQHLDSEQMELSYSMKWIKNPEEAVTIYEQMVNDGDGWFRNVEDQHVLAQELDPASNGYSYRWTNGNCEFGIYGPLSLTEMDAVASEFMGVFASLPIEVQNKWVPEDVIQPVRMLQADNAQEIEEYLGEDFILPLVQIDGWEPVDYYGTINKRTSREVMIFYTPQNGEKGTIIVEKKIYNKFEDVYESYEQNEMGEVIRYGDLEIYVAYNYDYILTICLQDKCMYVVTGAINLEETKRIYDQLMDLEKQNKN